MIITLALSASLDVTYEVDELNVGDITRPFAVTRVAGGKALNVARAASALGAEVSTLAALGGATGEWVAEMLAQDGVAATVVPLRRVTRTCIAVVERAESATSTDLYEPATELEPDEWEAYAAAARRAVTTASTGGGPWVALSGSVPPGVPHDELGSLLSELRRRGARVVVDGSGDGLRATAPAAELIKVNRREASELLGIQLETAADACDRLRERYGCDAVVTDGVAGSSALLGSIRTSVPASVRRGRFPAGSGDAFLGGLLAAFERGDSAEDALAAAASAGERNALVAGQGRLAAD
ncbi:1-phosphofructokinase family hexose kinase [Humibacter sp.]|uniref:1-phosphofructokinase family hexose kinase n=1 Tax=Humibacter sp. TaxID=1940291 RepID=UPI003F803D58